MDIRLGEVLNDAQTYAITPADARVHKPPLKANFESLYKAAIDIINDTNVFALRAEQLQVDLATGKTDDILTVLMAQDRAYSSLNFTTQVTNKIIESYREIMRMQI
jgi:flagellar hook-basal body complex protein FliE